jgi:mycofactocin system glycosyltransferase
MHSYVLDAWATRSDGGRVLMGGAPARLVRLTADGAAVLDAALAGEPPSDRAGRDLVRSLVEKGLLHPTGFAPSPVRARLSAVVPVRNSVRWIGEVVAALSLDCEVVVVDDGSTDGSPETAAASGARVISNRRTPGPSGARNAGLAAVSSDLVALVDADCIVLESWLAPLAGLFDEDPRLALAAPRVLSAAGPSSLAAYERACSPLDLGPAPSAVGWGRRLSYVPSAALLARREALLEVSGFAEELTIGEDVDLVWRLIKAGWTVRYAPDSCVVHHPRATIAGMAAQRARYGASAVILNCRHPGAVTPLRVPESTITVWVAALVRGPIAGAMTAATTAAAAAGADQSWASRRWLAGLTLRGHARATRHLARILTREWLPLTGLAAASSRRARRMGVLALVVDVLASRDNAVSPSLARHGFLRTVDNGAYAMGLWASAVRARSFGALLIRPVPLRRSGLIPRLMRRAREAS